MLWSPPHAGAEETLVSPVFVLGVMKSGTTALYVHSHEQGWHLIPGFPRPLPLTIVGLLGLSPRLQLYVQLRAIIAEPEPCQRQGHRQGATALGQGLDPLA